MTEVYDTHGLFDPATGRFVAGADWLGLWRLTLSGSWASNSAGRRTLALFRNGAQESITVQAPSPSGSTLARFSVDLRVTSATDYYELAMAQESGGALALNVGSEQSCSISGEFVRRLA